MTWYVPFWQVKWIRVLYSEFSTFTRDQEYLVSLNNTFDYIEGFVIINRTGILNNWRSSFDPKNQLQASQFSSDGKTLYCLEMAKYFNPDEAEAMNQVCHTKQLINSTCMTKIKALIAKKKKNVLISITCCSNAECSLPTVKVELHSIHTLPIRSFLRGILRQSACFWEKAKSTRLVGSSPSLAEPSDPKEWDSWLCWRSIWQYS